MKVTEEPNKDSNEGSKMFHGKWEKWFNEQKKLNELQNARLEIVKCLIEERAKSFHQGFFSKIDESLRKIEEDRKHKLAKSKMKYERDFRKLLAKKQPNFLEPEKLTKTEEEMRPLKGIEETNEKPIPLQENVQEQPFVGIKVEEVPEIVKKEISVPEVNIAMNKNAEETETVIAVETKELTAKEVPTMVKKNVRIEEDVEAETRYQKSIVLQKFIKGKFMEKLVRENFNKFSQISRTKVNQKFAKMAEEEPKIFSYLMRRKFPHLPDEKFEELLVALEEDMDKLITEATKIVQDPYERRKRSQQDIGSGRLRREMSNERGLLLRPKKVLKKLNADPKNASKKNRQTKDSAAENQ